VTHSPAHLAPVLLALALATSAPAQSEKSSRAPILAWQIQSSGTMTGLRGVSAVDAETAWASGAAGTVLRTTDSGRTWTSYKVPGAEAIDFRDIEAFDARTAIIMGIASPARMFRTEDGGATWTEVYRNAAAGMFLDAVDFAGPSDGWAVGDPIGGRIFLLTTSDGGRTWTVPVERRPAGFRESVVYVPGAGSTLVLAVGPSGSDFSLDDGRTWTPIPGPAGFHALSFAPDGSAGWAVGKSGLIARIRPGR